MRVGLTAEVQRIIVTVRSGMAARCPVCGTLFIEEMNGQATVTCKDRRHPRGEAVRIEFRTE